LERKEHIELLAEMMINKDIQVVELHGGISTKQRQERIALLSSKQNKDEPVVILVLLHPNCHRQLHSNKGIY